MLLILWILYGLPLADGEDAIRNMPYFVCAGEPMVLFAPESDNLVRAGVSPSAHYTFVTTSTQ